MKVKITAYCECGRLFRPTSKNDTLCKRCKEDAGIILPYDEFSIYANNGMKKRITGENNQFNDDYFSESDNNYY